MFNIFNIFANISNLFSPTMRRKMLRRCSIFNCFSLLNFSTLELFLCAVLHHYWISQPFFWFISVVLYNVAYFEHLSRRFLFISHCTCSQLHKLITIIYQRQIFLGHLVQFGSPQLWVVASVWQGIGSCELRRLDPEQLLHYVTLKDARWNRWRPNIIAVWQPLDNRCTAPNQSHWQLQVQVQNCANS